MDDEEFKEVCQKLVKDLPDSLRGEQVAKLAALVIAQYSTTPKQRESAVIGTVLTLSAVFNDDEDNCPCPACVARRAADKPKVH